MQADPDRPDNTRELRVDIKVAGEAQTPILVQTPVTEDQEFAALDLDGPITTERGVEFSTSVQVTDRMWVGVRAHATTRVRCGANQQVYAGSVVQTRTITDALDAIHVAADIWREEAHRIRDILERRHRGDGR